jgi:hypothetical protein
MEAESPPQEESPSIVFSLLELLIWAVEDGTSRFGLENPKT